MKRSPSYRSQSRNSSNDRVYDDRNNAKNKTPQKNDDPKVPGHIGKPPPQIVYPHLSSKDKPFSGRCQLFVGNVPNDMKDNEFRNLFEKFGPCKDVFVNSNRGFGFIKLETRQLAEKARAELDGIPIRGGRYLRVRMACHHAAIKIKYLPLCISNELLESTFSMFGEIERAVVIVDDKGKPVGEGIVEFARKQSAFNAINRISEGVFFMTNQPRPIEVEKYEPNDELDGLPELFVFKTPELLHEREQGARFAPPGSLEADMGHKWKKLYLLYKEQEDLLKKNFAEEVSKLEADQANLAIEQRKHMIMQDVQRRQEELRILEKRIDENKRKMENMRKDDDQKPRLFDDDMRQMVMKGEDSLLHRRPTDSTKSLDPPFITRGVERSAAPGALQPPAAPPGIRLGGMGAYMGNTLLGTSPGMQRVGLLTRPPLNTALLGDPKVRPVQHGVRFDNAAAFPPNANPGRSHLHPNAPSNGMPNMPLINSFNAVPNGPDVKRPRRF